jgi:hypothetical protein
VSTRDDTGLFHKLVVMRLQIICSVTYPIDSGPCLRVIAIATIGLPGRDIGETLVSAGVDPRVQESENGLAGAKTGVVEECDDGGGDLCEVSKSVARIQLKYERTGEAAEVPPLGVRTPP